MTWGTISPLEIACISTNKHYHSSSIHPIHFSTITTRHCHPSTCPFRYYTPPPFFLSLISTSPPIPFTTEYYHPPFYPPYPLPYLSTITTCSFHYYTLPHYLLSTISTYNTITLPSIHPIHLSTIPTKHYHPSTCPFHFHPSTWEEIGERA